jgi:hypothetical protein
MTRAEVGAEIIAPFMDLMATVVESDTVKPGTITAPNPAGRDMLPLLVEKPADPEKAKEMATAFRSLATKLRLKWKHG